MRVEEFMVTQLVSVESDDLLSTVRDLFLNGGFHHLPVIEDNRLVGIISDRDLNKAISPNIGTLSETEKDRATLNKRAHQIMTRRPWHLSPAASLHDAIALLNRQHISCIPLVDDGQRPVGIITWRDILRVLESKGFTLKT